MHKINHVPERKLNIFVTIFLYVSVFVITTYMLITPAKSMVNSCVCGCEEHVHTDECYEIKSYTKILSCNVNESNQLISHTHDELCYDSDGCLICPLENHEHIHDESCYDGDILVCGYVFHQHSETCFTVTDEPAEISVLSCNKEVHQHTSACYEHKNTQSGTTEEQNNIEDIYYTNNSVNIFSETSEPEVDGNNNDSNTFALARTNSLNVADYIDSIVMKYQLDDGTWKEATTTEELPVDANYRFDVKYKDVPISKLTSKNGQMILEGIPHWFSSEGTKEILYNSQHAAYMEVQGTTLVINFDMDFLEEQSKLNETLNGTIYVRGEIEWRNITGSTGTVKLPTLDKTFNFEQNLPQKYGKMDIVKSEPELTEDEQYFKYTITVTSLDTVSIPEVRVEDSFTVNGRYIDGYAGITKTATTLSTSPNEYDPYGTCGTIYIDSSKSCAVWNIGTVEAGQTYTLTYYAKIKEYYLGASARGYVKNTAELYSGDIPKDDSSSTFFPYAKVDVKKSKVSSAIDETGTGEIVYKVEVKADRNNNYTLVNLRVEDFFDEKYSPFIEFVYDGKEYKNGEFNCVIAELKPNEKKTIKYTVNVKNILLSEPDDVKLENIAQVFSENNSSRGEASNYLFGTNGVSSTIGQRKWLRKIDGGKIPETELTVAIAGGTVYEYDGTGNIVTAGNVPADFTNAENGRKYQVVINEGSSWDVSSAVLKDSFLTDKMQYKGYLKVQQFDFNGNVISGEGNDSVISAINQATPLKTAWLNIDSKRSFEFKPTDLEFDSGKYTYVLTYYAEPVNMGDVGTVLITNTFEVYGTIGVNGGTYAITNIKTGVSSTVQGDLHYNVEKKAWYYDNPDKDDNDSVLWIVKIDGNILPGFSLKDTPTENEVESETVISSPINEDSLVGIYKASSDLDITQYSNIKEFEADKPYTDTLSKEPTVNEYIKTNVTDASSLVDKSFVITNINTGTLAYMNNTWGKGIGAIRPQSFSSSDIVDDKLELSNPAVWTIHQKDGKYYFSSIENKVTYYLTSSGQATNRTTNVNQASYFDIEVADEGRILIKNLDGNYITFQNKAKFSTSSNVADDYTKLTLFERKGDNDYSYISSIGSAVVRFEKEIQLNDNEALYAIFKINAGQSLNDKKDANRIFHNSIMTKDSSSSEYALASEDDLIVKMRDAVLKESYYVFEYDGNDGFETLDGKIHNGQIDKTKIDGAGIYIEYYIHVNWDGTLSGQADVCDYLPECIKPEYIKYVLHLTGDPDPVFADIPELEMSEDWTKYQPCDVPYYYNSETHQIYCRITNLRQSATNNKTQVQLQVVCKVTDPEILLKGTSTDIENTVYVTGNNGTTISKDTAISNIKSEASIQKKTIEELPASTNGTTGIYENSVIKFMITANPWSSDLSTSDNNFLPVLIDELGDSSDFEFDESSIVIADSAGNAVTGCSYVIQDKDNKQLLTISKLPADKAITITYDVRIKSKPSSTKDIVITNNAYWEGYEPCTEPQVKSTFKYDLGGNIDLAGSPSIRITKSDNNNLNLKLEGATFELYESAYDGTYSGNPLYTETTDKNGKLTFAGNNIDYNKVYCIVEKEAPYGYTIDKLVHYVAVVRTDGEHDTFNIENYSTIKDEISIVYNQSVISVTITNSKGKIHVNKTFLNSDNEECTPAGNWYFGIYDDDPLTNNRAKLLQTLTITINDNAEKQFYLDGHQVSEPAFTCAEPDIVYYVYELDADQRIIRNGNMFLSNGHTFEVSYDSQFSSGSNKAIINSNMNISNQIKIFNMPETGGIGLVNYYIFASVGMAVLIIGFISMKLLSRKKE